MLHKMNPFMNNHVDVIIGMSILLHRKKMIAIKKEYITH